VRRVDGRLYLLCLYYSFEIPNSILRGHQLLHKRVTDGPYNRQGVARDLNLITRNNVLEHGPFRNQLQTFCSFSSKIQLILVQLLAD